MVVVVQGEWRKGDIGAFLASHGIDGGIYPEHNSSLGTIGGGNHFAELQQVEEVFEGRVDERAAQCGRR